jgi:hypothetical protein
VPAVTGVDGNDDIAPAHSFLRCRLDRSQPALRMQVDDKPIAVLPVRRCGETSRTHFLVEIEHDAQLTVCAHAAAN